MKYSMMPLFDRLLAKIGLVRMEIYRGQEAWVGFLENLCAKKILETVFDNAPKAKPTKVKTSKKIKKCR